MRRLWGDALSSYKGEFVNFENVRSFPKPVHGADLPVFFGGESGPALRRVAEYGNGWCGFNLDPGEAADRFAVSSRCSSPTAASAPTWSSGLAVYQTDYARRSQALSRAGVDELVIVNMHAPRTPEEAARGIEEAARKWIDAAAKL